MSAPVSQTQNETRAVDQKITILEEKGEMSAPVIVSQNKLQVMFQEIIKGKEQIEMKAAIGMKSMNNWLAASLKVKTPAKILGGLAMGALLMTATALPAGSIHADEPNQPLVSVSIPTYEETIEDMGEYELFAQPGFGAWAVLTLVSLASEVLFVRWFVRATGGPDAGVFFVPGGEAHRTINRRTAMILLPQAACFVGLLVSRVSLP